VRRVIALSFFRIKVGPGMRVIATGYPVSKTGNTANHYPLAIP